MCDDAKIKIELDKINDKVRAGFRKGYGASNKIYTEFGEKTQKQQRRTDTRNKLRINAKQAIEITRKETDGLQPEEMAVYLSSLPRNSIAGNCQEQAFDACLRIGRRLINLKCGYHISFASIKEGFHVFAALHKKNDVIWPNVLSMASQIVDDCWIVDPWANIVCKSSTYPLEFARKMRDWSSNGKYISMNGVLLSPQGDQFNKIVLTSKEIEWFNFDYRNINYSAL